MTIFVHETLVVGYHALVGGTPHMSLKTTSIQSVPTYRIFNTLTMALEVHSSYVYTVVFAGTTFATVPIPWWAV